MARQKTATVPGSQPSASVQGTTTVPGSQPSASVQRTTTVPSSQPSAGVQAPDLSGIKIDFGNGGEPIPLSQITYTGEKKGLQVELTLPQISWVKLSDSRENEIRRLSKMPAAMAELRRQYACEVIASKVRYALYLASRDNSAFELSTFESNLQPGRHYISVGGNGTARRAVFDKPGALALLENIEAFRRQVDGMPDWTDPDGE